MQGWSDPYWTWNVSKYPHIGCITRFSKDAWSPTLLLLHGDPKSLYSLKDHVLVCLQPDEAADRMGLQRKVASVVVELVDTFETVCDFNVEYFPFDTHKCTFDFVAYMQVSKYQIFAEWKIDPMWHYVKHSEWILDHVQPSFKISEDRFGLIKINRSHMSYTFSIRRRSAFYVIALFMPALVLTILTALIFVLPAESGEKISLGVSIVLSFTVFQLLLYDALPKSDRLPIFGEWSLLIVGCIMSIEAKWQIPIPIVFYSFMNYELN